jgi:ABC-2 type transport system ATP-binding protein
MIEVEHLSKIYGSTTAIKDVTFRAEPGEILGLLGPNGAGKTTTMRILAGYLPATQGEARVAGYEVHDQPMAVRQRIGYLPETPPLYLDMTVEGYLYFVSRIKGVPAGDRTSKVDWALDRCQLLKKRHVLIHKLSKGFRQRVGIAQAIVHDPPAIILDEPTVGLDPRQIISVRNLIKTLAEDKTVLLSTHILPEVSMTCHRVAIINQGEVVAVGSLEDLMAQRLGGTAYDLDVQGTRADIEHQLNLITGIKSVQWLSGAPEGRQQIRVTSALGIEPGPQIATALAEKGLLLYEMRRVAKSLEDIFLNLTTEEQKPTDDLEPIEEESS